jgi:hypothetical protein
MIELELMLCLTVEKLDAPGLEQRPTSSESLAPGVTI